MRILYLTHRLPYAPNRGDRIRAYYTLQALRGRADVDLVSLVHTRDEAAHAADLRDLVHSVQVAPVSRLRGWVTGAVSLPSSAPLTHALLDSAAIRPALAHIVADHRPDVVLAYCSSMARFALEPPLAGLPLVIDLVDVDSLKWQALAEHAALPLAWIYAREARTLAQFEARAISRAVTTIVVNDREREALAAMNAGARVEAVPSGVDVELLRPHDPPAPSQDVVFCGVMNYEPNEEAAAWLATEIWPRVRAAIPAARLRLVGASPSARVRRLNDPAARVEVTGGVPDVRPYLWSAAVAVAPLRIARGIQNKALEAVAAGLPVVVTPAVAAGLPDEVLAACAVADSADAFAAAIVTHVALRPVERRAIAGRANLSSLAWTRRLEPLIERLERAARATP